MDGQNLQATVLNPTRQSTNLDKVQEIDEKAPQAGDLCPRCHESYLDYDGLLNLTCHRCGFSLGGCYT
jgi:hypothetical protein